jgi:hypothetical protein
MTSRRDIAPNGAGWRRLSYTCRCGWVDWGHARPGSAKWLKEQIDTEQSAGQGLAQMNILLDGVPAYLVNYGQTMGYRALQVSSYRHWVVRRNLTLAERRSVALGIFLSASSEFESLQGSFPYSIIAGGSSFSGEDLISNLVGFYGVFESIYGDSTRPGFDARMRQICGEVSVEECYRLWDKHVPGGLDTFRNRSLQPIKFPCQECDESQSDASFPSRLSTIQPAPAGILWAPVKGRFIDGRLAHIRQAIEVSRRGEVTVRRAR